MAHSSQIDRGNAGNISGAHSDKLEALAARCEAAGGEYDPDLCAAIHDVLLEPKCIQPPNYCRSVDAALTLVPDGWRMSLSDVVSPGFHAALMEYAGHSEAFARAATPALALCAAALRARATQGDAA